MRPSAAPRLDLPSSNQPGGPWHPESLTRAPAAFHRQRQTARFASVSDRVLRGTYLRRLRSAKLPFVQRRWLVTNRSRLTPDRRGPCSLTGCSSPVLLFHRGEPEAPHTFAYSSKRYRLQVCRVKECYECNAR